MKTKKKSRLSKKAPVKRKPRRKAGKSASAFSASSAIKIASSAVLKLNTCEEVEVGDIGGFGSSEELESHENRCVQPTSQFCTTCGKKLCGTHYELLHRDHDSARGRSSTQG